MRPLLALGFVRTLAAKFYTASKYFEESNICKNISPKKTVLSGAFEGMRYHSFQSYGSVIIPKIVGSYEDELLPIFKKLFTKNYSEIIDIGTAEGYYAIGLSLKFPTAKVFGYEVNEQAKILCHNNAEENNMASRLQLCSFLDAEQLSRFVFTQKGLIICDCEGYEKQLFTSASAKNLHQCDLIIELHDCNDNSISKTILPLFNQTHKLTLVKSNPHKKVSDYPFLKNKPCLHDDMLDERNGIIMYWAVLEAL